MDLYLAGGLFTTAEVLFNETLAEYLRRFGHTCFVPQESEENHIGLDFSAIFKSDVGGIDKSQVIVANMDGPDQDSGTCWEVGYGYARGKKIVLYRTDLRRGQEAVNLMMTECADLIIAETLIPISRLAATIHNEMRRKWPNGLDLAPDQFGGFGKDAPINGERYRHIDK